MPHIDDPRGSNQSPKMTKDTPKIGAFPLAPFKSGLNHVNATLNSNFLFHAISFTPREAMPHIHDPGSLIRAPK